MPRTERKHHACKQADTTLSAQEGRHTLEMQCLTGSESSRPRTHWQLYPLCSHHYLEQCCSPIVPAFRDRSAADRPLSPSIAEYREDCSRVVPTPRGRRKAGPSNPSLLAIAFLILRAAAVSRTLLVNSFKGFNYVIIVLRPVMCLGD